MTQSPSGKITRALLSVSDKSGLIAFATGLHKLGIILLSTGGTAKALQQANLPVIDVSAITDFPEIMDGRVKTLHPKIHGGLLAVRANADHVAAQTKHNIENIDLLVVNLYPFEETVARNGTSAEIIENIDVGGPAMIRAAAKNHHDVTVIVSPTDYEIVLKEMIANHSETTLKTRERLAAKAFGRTASYDAAIALWFNRSIAESSPDYFAMGGTLVQKLRYGENPHQSASFYKSSDLRNGVRDADQIQGKELSYNNLNDADAALECLAEISSATNACCVIVKHANPCGVAVSESPQTAYFRALACDPTSAFGGIIAFNQALDLATATDIAQIFTEVILAPGISDEARQFLSTKKNLRVLILKSIPDASAQAMQVKSIIGGLLVQTRDNSGSGDVDSDYRVVTKRVPTAEEWADLKFAFQVAKHVKSNAIVYAKDGTTLGIGAGQMSRIDSARIALRKNVDAVEASDQRFPTLVGSVVASDAFFPFADGLLQAAEAGVTAVIQPGGSMRDQEVIAVADAHNLAMVFTGVRHFKH